MRRSSGTLKRLSFSAVLCHLTYLPVWERGTLFFWCLALHPGLVTVKSSGLMVARRPVVPQDAPPLYTKQQDLQFFNWHHFVAEWQWTKRAALNKCSAITTVNWSLLPYFTDVECSCLFTPIMKRTLHTLISCSPQLKHLYFIRSSGSPAPLF